MKSLRSQRQLLRSTQSLSWIITRDRNLQVSRAIATTSALRQADGVKGLRVSQSRLMDTIHHTCQWGPGKPWGDQPTETGMSRLTLSDADKDARDWFVDTTRSLGCTVTVDAIGNIFAVRPGKNEGPATFVGSHLDTQPTGGRYDGILGIQAGIEMLKVLEENKIETEFPVGVVNWTKYVVNIPVEPLQKLIHENSEEGARFPVSMMGSGVWAEMLPLEKAYNLKSVTGEKIDLKSELERIGYLGDTPASYRSVPMAAHFELHIEQGPTLEAEGKKVGVVQGVQAYKWFTVEVQGRGERYAPRIVISEPQLTALRLSYRHNSTCEPERRSSSRQ